MKKFINKKFIVVTALALLLFVTVGSTLAYIFTKTEPVENKFDPSKVSCAVVENGNDPVSSGNVPVSSKTNVQIKNTGDTDAYIRVAVVVNWMSADGTRVWATKPVQGADYSISYNLNDNGWVDGGDGYYYYTQPVDPGDMTNILITSATQNATGPKGTDEPSTISPSRSWHLPSRLTVWARLLPRMPGQRPKPQPTPVKEGTL